MNSFKRLLKTFFSASASANLFMFLCCIWWTVLLYLLTIVMHRWPLYKNLRSRFGIERYAYTESHIAQIPCVCMYVCMYVCDQTPQTTEPICIKIIPANRAFYAVVILSVHPCVCQSQATRAIGYLDLKYLPNTMNILLSRERCF